MFHRYLFTALFMVLTAAGYTQAASDSTAPSYVPAGFLFEQPVRTRKKAVEKQIARDLRKLRKVNNRYQAANKKVRRQFHRLDIHADTLQRFSPVHTKELDKLKKYDAILHKELKTDKYDQALADLREQVTANQKESRYIRQGLDQLKLGGQRYNPAILKKIRIALDMKKKWESYYNDQDKMETQLLYFLEKYHKTHPAASPYKHAGTPESLEQQGYQTNRSVKQQVQDKLGLDDEQYSNMLTEKQQAAQQVHADKLKALQAQAQQAKGEMQDLQNAYRSIRYNEVRSTPFRFRFKPIYNFNVQPANIVTGNNSLFISIGLEHKLSGKISQGAGIHNTIGFNIRKPYYFKYDHCFLFYYIRYDIIWGIALQGGYEFNVYNRYNNHPGTATEQGANPFVEYLTRNHNNIAYLGLSKSYRISEAWQGTLLFGYDFLWQRVSTSQATPWIIRLGIRRK